MHAPIRYVVPAAVACTSVSPRPSFDVSVGLIVPTIVTSSPSRIHVIPSPMTTIQCHRAHGSRSSRNGMSVVTCEVEAANGPPGSSERATYEVPDRFDSETALGKEPYG